MFAFLKEATSWRVFSAVASWCDIDLTYMNPILAAICRDLLVNVSFSQESAKLKVAPVMCACDVCACACVVGWEGFNRTFQKNKWQAKEDSKSTHHNFLVFVHSEQIKVLHSYSLLKD